MIMVVTDVMLNLLALEENIMVNCLGALRSIFFIKFLCEHKSTRKDG